MKKIKIAVVGLGDISKFMLLIFKMTGGMEVVDICDINKDRLKTAGRFFKKAGQYTDYKEMFEKTGADAVYLAVPHFLHYPMMKKAVESGMHILCEKPITIKEEHAAEVVDKARKLGLVVAVNYQYRYDSNCRRLVAAVQNGKLGKIHFVRCAVPWSRDSSYFEKAPWHSSREKAGGGTLITQGSHMLDIILWMLQGEIKEVKAQCKNIRFMETEVEDFCSARILMEDGAVIQFMSTMAAPEEDKIRLEVFGDKGYAEYTKKGRSVSRFTGIPAPPKIKGKPAVHAIQRSARQFRNAVLGNGRHLCQGEDAIVVLKAVNMIYRSSEERV